MNTGGRMVAARSDQTAPMNGARAAELVAALAANDKAQVLRLLTADCTWEVVPWRYVARGQAEVRAFLGVASRTRTYRNAGQRIRIDNWFSDGEWMCVELTNIASPPGLPHLAVRQPICLTLHLTDRGADRVREYFQAPFLIDWLLRLVPLVTRWQLRAHRRRVGSTAAARRVAGSE
jgi:SnoaL-like domain